MVSVNKTSGQVVLKLTVNSFGNSFLRSRCVCCRNDNRLNHRLILVRANGRGNKTGFVYL